MITETYLLLSHHILLHGTVMVDDSLHCSDLLLPFLHLHCNTEGWEEKTKLPPDSSKTCFASCYFSSVCRMMCVPSLTLKVCFHIRLIKGGGGVTCTYEQDFVTSQVWEPIVVQWRFETSSAHSVTMDFSVRAPPTCFYHLLAQFVP